MDNESVNNYGLLDSESLSEEFERDARRYNKEFTEEQEVKLI